MSLLTLRGDEIKTKVDREIKVKAYHLSKKYSQKKRK